MHFPESFTIISDEVSQDLAEVARVVREFRLPGIELRSAFGRAFKDLTAADIAEIRRWAKGEGWRIFGCASPVFKCEVDDPAAIASHQALFRRACDIAHELECDLVRVFTFLRRGAGENEAVLPRVVDHLRSLEGIAAAAGVRIGIENEHSCTVATAREAAALFERLPAPFGLVWDPCNVLYLPDAASPEPGRIAARIVHVHVKDARRATAAQPAMATPVDAGDVGWPGHFAALEREGYRGRFSLETHWRAHELNADLLHLPAGHAFSHGGAAASRLCLENIRQMALRASS